MITPIRTMKINDICQRKDDLLMSADDIEEIAKNVRAKAIDEFVKSEDYLMDKIKEETADVNIDFEWRKVVCLDDIRRMLHQGLCEIAEQMKAGGIDG